MLKLGLLFYFLLSLPALGDEGSCYFKDLGARMGPVRDQGEIGWCYANVAADLLGYKFQRQLDNPISASFLALLYNHHSGNQGLEEGGEVKVALKAALNPAVPGATDLQRIDRGMCPMSKENEVLKNGPKVPLEQKLASLVHLKKLYDAGRQDPSQRRAFDDLMRSYAEQGSILGKLDRARVENIFAESRPEDFYIRFADLVCGSQRTYNSRSQVTVVDRGPKATWTYTQDNVIVKQEIVKYDLMKELTLQLNSDNIVAVGLTVDFLYREKPRGSLSHGMIVVGRQWRNNSCEYLLRNSWGPDCRIYPAPYNSQCVAGNVWVSETVLMPRLEHINYLIDGPDPGGIRQ